MAEQKSQLSGNCSGNGGGLATLVFIMAMATAGGAIGLVLMQTLPLPIGSYYGGIIDVFIYFWIFCLGGFFLGATLGTFGVIWWSNWCEKWSPEWRQFNETGNCNDCGVLNPLDAIRCKSCGRGPKNRDVAQR